MNSIIPRIYTDQSAKALRHSLIEGPLDLGQFNILRQGSIKVDKPEIRITARVIGASHLLSFEIDGKIFHELFACERIKSNQNEILSGGPLGREHIASDLWLDNGLNYAFAAAVVPFALAEEWLHHTERKAVTLSKMQDNNSIGLYFDFPIGGSQDIVGKTIILARYDHNQRKISVTTAHSYPNEMSIVKSFSALHLDVRRQSHRTSKSSHEVAV